MGPSDRLRLNSYADLFQPDRRIHAIDGHRIPVPGGIPIHLVGHGALLAVLIALLGMVPGLGELLSLIHPLIRWAIIPVAGAILIDRLRPDGRSPSAVALSWVVRDLRLGCRRPSDKRRRHRAAIRRRARR